MIDHSDSKEYKNLFFTYMKSDNLADIIEILSNTKVCEYLFFAPCPKEHLEDYFLPKIHKIQDQLKEQRLPNTHLFVIKKDDRVVGYCGIDAIAYSSNNYTIGYTIDEPFWGQGLGTIVGEFLVYYAFEVLKARKLTGDCFEQNIGSAKIMKNLGFKLEGVVRDLYKKNNIYCNNLLFGLLK
ncbi:MAG: GNAT family N-acetyltransferase [Spirochaetota bacterium]|nr:GNAT family N-acetyltransferase [Spirochaetota bacterium]